MVQNFISQCLGLITVLRRVNSILGIKGIGIVVRKKQKWMKKKIQDNYH